MRRSAVVVLLVGSLAACSSSKPSASEPTSTSSTTTNTAPTGSVPRFDVVLDDTGLRFPPGKTLAGPYLISFEDRRSAPPPNEHLRLEFAPSGPYYIILIDVPAGGSKQEVIIPNMVAYVVDVDHANTGMTNPQDIARVTRNFPVTNPLTIDPTPQYSTPVT